MAQNILVTGAAGYIGGTVLAKLLQSGQDPIKSAKLWAAVRTPEQAEVLSQWKVNVLQLDVNDTQAVKEAIVGNNINIVVHTASMDLSPASNIIKALGELRQASGREVSYIHPYVTAMFSAEGGWTHGRVKDTDSIHELQKEIGAAIPVRAASIAVIELGQELGVKTFTIPVPSVYGRGSGLVKILSLPLPYQVRAAVKTGKVYKFEKEGRPYTTHINDLSALYVLLIEKILLNEDIPNGEKGFYFPVAHRWPWHAVMQGIADSLYARGLVKDPALQVWPDWDIAAQTLGLPRQYIEPMMTSSGDMVPVNVFKLGWKPEWDEERFLKNIDAEVQDALELDHYKPSAYDTFIKES